MILYGLFRMSKWKSLSSQYGHMLYTFACTRYFTCISTDFCRRQAEQLFLLHAFLQFHDILPSWTGGDAGPGIVLAADDEGELVGA